jgi:hypothetical protein
MNKEGLVFEFLFEQLPNIILTLFGISLVRSFIRSRWPRINEKHFDISLILILITSFVIGWITDNQKARESSTLRTQLAQTEETARQTQETLNAERHARAQAEEKRKTPPKLRAELKSRAPENLFVSISSENLIPFEFEFGIVTMNNIRINPKSLEYLKVFPTEQQRLFKEDVNINWEKVKDNYMELRFNFRSLAPELFKETGHIGSIIKKYRVADTGDLVLIE